RARQSLLAYPPPRNHPAPPMDDPRFLDRPRSSHHPSHSGHLFRHQPPLPPHPSRILRRRLLDRLHPPPDRRRSLDPNDATTAHTRAPIRLSSACKSREPLGVSSKHQGACELSRF